MLTTRVLLQGRVRSTSYTSSKEFDIDMVRLFEKGRRWYEPCTESYGRVLTLQVRSLYPLTYFWVMNDDVWIGTTIHPRTFTHTHTGNDSLAALPGTHIPLSPRWSSLHFSHSLCFHPRWPRHRSPHACHSRRRWGSWHHHLSRLDKRSHLRGRGTLQRMDDSTGGLATFEQSGRSESTDCGACVQVLDLG